MLVAVVTGGLAVLGALGALAWWRLDHRLTHAERQGSDLALETRAARVRIEQLEAQVRRLRAVVLGPCPDCTGSGRCARCEGTGEIARLPAGPRRS
jgi:hypothetical protein